MTATIRVVIADDHPLIVAGISGMLAQDQSIELVGNATCGDEAQHVVKTTRPDVLLLDLQMPGTPVIETIAHVRMICPQTRIIVLTAHADDRYVRAMLAVRVEGYLLKDEAVESITQAVHVVAQGGSWLSRRIAAQVATWASDPEHDPPQPPSAAEMNVLRLMAQGLTNAQIAGKLCVAERTVRFHVENLFTRLG
ncbi:MAG: response regulator transcription factor [Blastochloris sp.]|nr:response regulator transcription factor [Blastochloris sp.]